MTETRPAGGWLRENPVAAILVGLCPAAAVTGRVIDALWMSLGFAFVLVLTRVGRVILHFLHEEPDSAGSAPAPRPFWPMLGVLFLASCFTASFELILGAFAPQESASLGIYIPLVAVNCIVLERATGSGFPSSAHDPASRLLRAIGGACAGSAGFAISLVVISLVRETLGSGTITLFPMGAFSGTVVIAGISAAPARALLYAGGGFLCLGYLAGLVRLTRRGRKPPDTGEAERV